MRLYYSKHTSKQPTRFISHGVLKRLHLLLNQSLQVVLFFAVYLILVWRCRYVYCCYSCSGSCHFLWWWLLFFGFLCWSWSWCRLCLYLFDNGIVALLTFWRWFETIWAILLIITRNNFLFSLFYCSIKLHKFFGHIRRQVGISKRIWSYSSIYNWLNGRALNRIYFLVGLKFMSIWLLNLIWINVASCTQFKWKIFFVV